jgi:YbbR domain-containing protein
MLLENLGLKLASLVLALLLYAHVVTDQERESTIQIPVTLVGLPDTLVATGELPGRVGVKVRGKWKDLIRLTLTRPYLTLDLADVPAGPYRSSITADDIRGRAIPAELSKLLTVSEVLEPRTVDLHVEPKASKLLPVVARVVGSPPVGFRLAGPARVEPDSVRVEGPVERLASLDTLYTVAVDITGERERIQRQVELDLAPDVTSPESRRCLVTLEMTRAEPERGTDGR